MSLKKHGNHTIPDDQFKSDNPDIVKAKREISNYNNYIIVYT